MRRALVLVGWLFSSGLCARGYAQQPPSPPGEVKPAEQGEAAAKSAQLARARQHFEQALAHYTEGRYREAIEQLEAARELDPSGKDLIYNLALVHEKLDHLARAEQYFRKYLALEGDPKERERIEAIIHRLRGAQREREVRQREEARARIATEPVRADSRVLGLAAAAATAFVVGGVFGVQALRKYPGHDDRTRSGRSAEAFRADARTAHRWALVADLSLLIGVLSGGTAAVLALQPRSPEQPAAAARGRGRALGVGF